MEKKYCWHGNDKLSHMLNSLPRKIMSMQDKHNLVEFVLHELCNKGCFDIAKAAYLVDNPDFDCMKGIAGFSYDECFNENDIWACPDDFSDHMRKSPFNQKVRGLQRNSCTKGRVLRDEVVGSIAHDLGMQSYKMYDLRMPHDNHGFFVYEQGADHDEREEECLLNGISLLSFCPIY
jgi:hypothetical protein